NTPSTFNVAYAFAEQPVSGWSLTGLSCSVDPVSGSTASTNGATATINPHEAGIITCAYTNSEPTVAIPTFSPAAGTYTAAQTVTISTGTRSRIGPIAVGPFPFRPPPFSLPSGAFLSGQVWYDADGTEARKAQ